MKSLTSLPNNVIIFILDELVSNLESAVKCRTVSKRFGKLPINKARTYFLNASGSLITKSNFKKKYNSNNSSYSNNSNNSNNLNLNKIQSAVKNLAKKSKYGDVIVYPSKTYDDSYYTIVFVNSNHNILTANYDNSVGCFILPKKLQNDKHVRFYLTSGAANVKRPSLIYTNGRVIEGNYYSPHVDSKKIKFGTKYEVQNIVNTGQYNGNKIEHSFKLPKSILTFCV